MHITVIAPEIPYFCFEVKKLSNEVGMAPALRRANKLANIILGENQYNSFFSQKGNNNV